MTVSSQQGGITTSAMATLQGACDVQRHVRPTSQGVGVEIDLSTGVGGLHLELDMPALRQLATELNEALHHAQREQSVT